ncbi:hypothetical protein SAMN05216404_11221 [Nitrosospira multiformis]|uniref:Uncharacterized protein n=1 Tax=Nitrosospira multiformis TaxID=1231 RepID=A0A1H8M6S1_9PROT|nr:hypothetical protein [Nitrosospira multiformis]SEO13011.1 hypothetical protein SAMN05216404_11221 [Nitrosospira multiformis]
MPSFTFCAARQFIRNIELVEQKRAEASFERKRQLPSLKAKATEAEEQHL